jgi:two-component system osmolarity sensor histidine kinase EnvZ
MIVVPTIVVQIVAIYVFFYTHVDNISKYMARGVLGEIKFIQNSTNISENKQLVLQFAKNVDLEFDFQANKKISKRTKGPKEVVRESKILSFVDLLPIIDPLHRFKMELESYGFETFLLKYNPMDNDLLTLKIELPKGVLSFNIPTKRITSSSKYVFTLWLIFTSIITSVISTIFLKNQIKSIQGLRIAAERLGRGEDDVSFKPSGAKEIRSVGVSFIRMKNRIMKQINQRTLMLSAISHDLRTPLTRMKLQLEMMPDDEAKIDLKADIKDMEKMINEYLDFAKFEGIKIEPSKNVNLKNFFEKMIIYYQKINQNISYKSDLDDDLEINLKKNSFKRAIRNLIENALHYGTLVFITTYKTKNHIKIIIDDNGCGVPPDKMNDIFKPFYRIDDSRNLDKDNHKAGAGLGLAIVKDVISFHNGKIKVAESPFGGLRIKIYLPINNQ